MVEEIVHGKRWAPTRALVVVLVGVAVAAAAVWPREGASRAAPQTARATRADLVVTVGGVGRIVTGAFNGQALVPSSATTAATSTSATPSAPTTPSTTSTTTAAPAGSVFPRASGRIAALFIRQGQHVRAGDPLAELDDGGSAAAAVLQAQNDLASAELELAQKRTSDPLRGIPATPVELAAGRAAVLSARARLAMLGRPRPADVKAARSDVARAKADLQAVQGGSPERRAQALEIAHQNVAAAQGRLDALLALPTQADLAAAVADLRRAEADYEALIRSDRTQPVTLAEIDAARAAIEAANQKLAKVRAGAASADVASAQAELTRARSELRTLEAGPGSVALDAARRAVDASRARLHQLLGSPLVTDVTAARLDLRKAVADLAVLRLRGGPASSYDIGLARLKVQAAKARVTLARFGEKQLTVRTPWTGTVTSVLTLPGAPVDAATPIATIADLDHMKVAVDLSEFDIAQVRPGQAATVSVDALGGNVSPGKVLAEALTGTDNGGVVTFPVLVGISAAKDIKPGMNVSVRIVVQSRHDVVQVPLEAVTRDDAGHAIVSVIEASGSTSTRRVSLGLSNNKDVEIVRGLAAGARVALAGG